MEDDLAVSLDDAHQLLTGFWAVDVGELEGRLIGSGNRREGGRLQLSFFLIENGVSRFVAGSVVFGAKFEGIGRGGRFAEVGFAGGNGSG